MAKKKALKKSRGRGKTRLLADTSVRFSGLKMLSPADVILVDNRPGSLHRYHTMLEAAANLSTGQPFGSDEAHSLDLSGVSEPQTKALLDRIERGLTRGAFKDTTRIEAWIASVNEFANWNKFGVPPLKLVLAHAEQEIDKLLILLKERRQHPAAIILSGSPKMFSEVRNTPVVQKTIELVRYAIEQRIPVFGICFGMHLLAHVCYHKVPVRYLKVPKEMKYLLHGSGETLEYKVVTPRKRYMHYGVAILADVKPDVVTISLQKGARSIGVHSQVVFLDELLKHGCRKEDALVLRTRRFASEPNSKAETVTQTFVEVFRCAPSEGEPAIVYGSQQHPELTADLIYALTFVRSFAAALEREGHDIKDLRDRLRSYMYRHPSEASAYSAGAKVGLNFFKHVLAPFYIHRLRAEERITKKQAKRLRDRLKKWGRKRNKGRKAR